MDGSMIRLLALLSVVFAVGLGPLVYVLFIRPRSPSYSAPMSSAWSAAIAALDGDPSLGTADNAVSVESELRAQEELAE